MVFRGRLRGQTARRRRRAAAVGFRRRFAPVGQRNGMQLQTGRARRGRRVPTSARNARAAENRE